jgi:FMN-dependent NADH-azoreductase
MAGECPARWRQKRAEDEFAQRAVEEEKIPGLDVTKGHSEGFILGL